MVFREIFFVLGILHGSVSSEVEVVIKQNGSSYSGSDTTTLVCRHTADDLIAIELLGKYRNADKFNIIATMYPGEQSLFSHDSTHLVNRTVLTNITESSREASMKFKNLTCNDEGQYQCRITYFNDIQKLLTSSPVNLSITVPPSIPEYVFVYSKSKELDLRSSYLVEGDSATFFCTGDVGNPAETLDWHQQYDNGSTRNLTGNNSPLIEKNGSCTNYQNSNLTIQVSRNDHLSAIRCSVRSPLSNQDLSIRTPNIKVYYKVRTPKISKRPDKIIYTGGVDNHITLTCHSDGNPKPDYKWYFKSTNMNKTDLSSSSTYNITDVNVNKSGRYICRAQNSINNDPFEEENSVNITIAKESTDGSSNLGFGTFGEKLFKLATTMLVIFI